MGGGQRTRSPLRIAARDGLLLIAGLAGRWTDPKTGEVEPALTILTCPPNELVEPIHNRMPVLLDRERAKLWLDPEAGAANVEPLLVPCPADWLVVRPASRLVNDHRNEGPELLQSERASSRDFSELRQVAANPVAVPARPGSRRRGSA